MAIANRPRKDVFMWCGSSYFIFENLGTNSFYIYIEYSKSPHIRTYFFEGQAEIGSYFKDTMTNIRVYRFLFEE